MVGQTHINVVGSDCPAQVTVTVPGPQVTVTVVSRFVCLKCLQHSLTQHVDCHPLARVVFRTKRKRYRSPVFESRSKRCPWANSISAAFPQQQRSLQERHQYRSQHPPYQDQLCIHRILDAYLAQFHRQANCHQHRLICCNHRRHRLDPVISGPVQVYQADLEAARRTCWI